MHGVRVGLCVLIAAAKNKGEPIAKGDFILKENPKCIVGGVIAYGALNGGAFGGAIRVQCSAEGVHIVVINLTAIREASKRRRRFKCQKRASRVDIEALNIVTFSASKPVLLLRLQLV